MQYSAYGFESCSIDPQHHAGREHEARFAWPQADYWSFATAAREITREEVHADLGNQTHSNKASKEILQLQLVLSTRVQLGEHVVPKVQAANIF